MKPQSDLHSIEDIPWTEISEITSGDKGPGITERILSHDPANRDYGTRLVKLAKGFRSTETVTHPFWEEIFILKGTVIDKGNKITAKAGYYACRHPGMPHGPLYAPEEVITFEVRYMPKD